MPSVPGADARTLHLKVRERGRRAGGPEDEDRDLAASGVSCPTIGWPPAATTYCWQGSQRR